MGLRTKFFKSNQKDKGKANGIKIVSEKKINRIMKRNGIDNSNKGTLDGTNCNRGQEDF